VVDPLVVADLLRRHPDLRMSFDEFLASGKGVHGDWVEGTVRLMEPDTATHNRVVLFLTSVVQLYVERRSCGEVLPRFQMRARPDLPSREVDLLVLKPESTGKLRDFYLDGPADLVIEVVSEESRELDSAVKLREYAAGGVGEYWLIDPERKQAEAFRRTEAGRFEAVDLGTPAMLRSEALPGMWVAVNWLWKEPLPRQTWVLQEWGLI